MIIIMMMMYEHMDVQVGMMKIVYMMNIVYMYREENIQ